MKTTIDIADPLFLAAKRLAASEGLTLRALIEQGLRQALQSRSNPAQAFKLRQASYKGKGLHPQAQAMGWDAIRAMSYDDARR